MTLPCFFCLTREATHLFSLRPPGQWPEPIPANAKLAVCDECDGLSAEAKATIIWDHATNLRTIARREAAESN